MSAYQSPSSQRFRLNAFLTLCLIGLLIVLLSELPAARASVSLYGETLSIWDSGVLSVALLARFILWGAVFGWGVNLLFGDRHPRMRWGFFIVAASVLSLLVTLQSLLQIALGNPLWYYVGKLGSPQTVQWVGGWRYILILSAGLLVAALMIHAIIWWISARFLVQAAHRWGAGNTWGRTLTCLAIFILFTSAQLTATRPDLVSTSRGTVLWPVTLLEQDYRYPASSQSFQKAMGSSLDKVSEAFDRSRHIALPEKISRDTAMDVVLIVCESFRSKSVNRQTMPLLMRRIDERGGWVASSHYAGSNVSELGMFSLVTGTLAIDYWRRVHIEKPLLPMVFRSAGYHTLFTTSGFYRGFEFMERFLDPPAFDESALMESSGSSDWHVNDRKVLTQLANRLNQSERPPLLALAYLMVTHYPYVPPPDAPSADMSHGSSTNPLNHGNLTRKLLSGSEADYNRCLLWLDREVDTLLSGIDLSRTIVILTGDHGESFGEDGVMGHASRASDEQMTTPFLAWIPGERRFRTLEHPTYHIDLLPLLWRLASGHASGQADPHAVFKDWNDHAANRVILLAPCSIGPVAGLSMRENVLVAIHGDQRLLLSRLQDRVTGRGRLEWFGGVLPDGRIDRSYSPPPAEAQRWSETIERAARESMPDFLPDVQ